MAGRQCWSENGRFNSPILPIRNCIDNLWANRLKPLAKTAQCRYADAVFDGANPRAQERVGRITLGAPLSPFPSHWPKF